ncbi:AP-3 complex subunit beta-2-like isoform X2 [Cetorhinus maximus]
MSIKRRGMFELHLKSFYIRSTDPTQIKVLKLEVLTNLASETNISTILREFQTYIKSQDKDFVAGTIQAIGRCATNIDEVRDTCLNGLVQLLSNRDELVVAESVVVIKKLLQMQPSQHSDIIRHMAKLIDNIMVPMARASILWLIGEYCEHVPKIAPDVLRKMAKSFTNEEDIVKLQIINLAAKLYLTNSKQTKLLTQYVLNLAKYDQNYDIRDRARFIRQLIVPTEKSGVLSKYAKKVFLAQKPAPVLESSFKDRDHFQLGSLSHLLNSKAGGYQELPDWPESAPDPSVRNVEEEALVETEVRIGLLGDWKEVSEWTKPSGREKRKEKVEKPFYSDSELESEPTESADSESLTASESESMSEIESESGSGSDEESDEETKLDNEKKKKVRKVKSKKRDESEDSGQSEGEEKTVKKRKDKEELSSSSSSSSDESSSEKSSSESESEEDSESDTGKKSRKKSSTTKPPPRPLNAKQKEISLLDLDDFSSPPTFQTSPSPNTLSKSLNLDLQGLTLTDATLPSEVVSPSLAGAKTYELLHRVTGEGLSVEYNFNRRPFSPDHTMVSVQMQFTNNSATEFKNLHISEPKLQPGMRMQGFKEIASLQPGEVVTDTLGIDFCDSTQAANFQLCSQTRQFYMSIQPPVGELMMPVFMTENTFKQEQGKLMGMNEIKEKLTLPEKCRSDQAIVQQVMSTANLGRVPCGLDNEYRFAARTVSGGALVLVTLVTKDGGVAQLTISCEKMVIGTMMVKDIMQALTH